MTEFGCLTLFVLSFVLFPCEGQITSPPDGTNFTFLPGSTAKIQWTFGNDIKTVQSRIWYFTGSDGSESVIARIVDDDPPREIPNNTLPGVTIETPATLVLNNVDKRYNGKYRFSLSATGAGGDFHVVVFIAEKPTVTLSCSSPITVYEGDDFTCVGRGEGGNPLADVTWYKDGVQIGETGKKEQTLSLSDVSRIDSGTYECEVRSHTDDRFADKKLIELKVNFKPDKPKIKFDPKEPANVGESVTVTCESDGFPTPSYTVFHNDTVVSTDKTYAISNVKWSDAGKYTCYVKNILGSNSTSAILTVAKVPPTTIQPNILTTAHDNKPDNGNSCKTEWYIVIVILVSGIIIGIFLSYIVWCSRRRWFRNRNPEPKTTEVDSTYQELDLSKMNKEDNYQSLSVNAARNDAAANDNDSTYTQLSKTRDVEDNYQSLT